MMLSLLFRRLFAAVVAQRTGLFLCAVECRVWSVGPK